MNWSRKIFSTWIMNGKLPVTNGCISLQSSVVPRREHQHCCKNGHCAWSKQRWSDLYLSAETLAKSAKLFMLCIWGLQIKHMYILYILYVHNGGGVACIYTYMYILRSLCCPYHWDLYRAGPPVEDALPGSWWMLRAQTCTTISFEHGLMLFT